MSGESSIRFEAEGLRLEGRLSLPPGATVGVVVCHPHPEYGGTMDNPVVAAVTARLAAGGIATLRFNFRGVGASEGSYSGLGETADAKAAVTRLAAEAGLRSIALAGYSFGAMIASLVAAEDSRIDRLVAIALPATMFDTSCLARCGMPKLFLHPDRDQYCPVDALTDVVESLPGPARVRWLEGADHFLAGFESEVAGEAARFVRGDLA